jgi:hypothetical protein
VQGLINKLAVWRARHAKHRVGARASKTIIIHWGGRPRQTASLLNTAPVRGTPTVGNATTQSHRETDYARNLFNLKGEIRYRNHLVLNILFLL